MPTELPYHCQLNKIGRSQGRSSTASAAYRSGERIVDERTGEIFDYTRKRGVEGSLIVLPGGGTMARAALWNAVEIKHKRGDAVVAREIEVALPRTLNAEQRRRLVQSYAAKLANRYGVAVDACIHEPHAVTDADLIANPDQFFVTEKDGRRHNGNWHCHILMSACHCDAEGVLGKKVVELDEMHCYRAGIPNAAQEQRPAWAAAVNDALVDAGQGDYFVDHRSFEERGITDRLPSKHRGPAVTAIKRRGGQSDVADAQAAKQAGWLGRAVEAASEAVEAIEAELANAVREAAQAVAVAAVAVVAPSIALADAPAPAQEARQGVSGRVPVVPPLLAPVRASTAPPAPALAVPDAVARQRAMRRQAAQLAELRKAELQASAVASAASMLAAQLGDPRGSLVTLRRSLSDAQRERETIERQIQARGWIARLQARLGDSDAERVAELRRQAQDIGRQIAETTALVPAADRAAQEAQASAREARKAKLAVQAAQAALTAAQAEAEQLARQVAQRLRQDEPADPDPDASRQRG